MASIKVDLTEQHFGLLEFLLTKAQVAVPIQYTEAVESLKNTLQGAIETAKAENDMPTPPQDE